MSSISPPLRLATWANAAQATAIQEMLALRVHRMFVVDDNGVLVGVISALDVLRDLRPAGK